MSDQAFEYATDDEQKARADADGVRSAVDAYLAALAPAEREDPAVITTALRELREAVKVQGAGGEDEHAKRAARLVAVFEREHESDQALRLALVEAVDPPPVIRMRSAAEIHDLRPAPILSLSGRGALLSIGTVAIVAGEGGLGKSSLITSLAVDVAAAAVARDGEAVLSEPIQPGPGRPAGPLTLHGGGGPVVLLSYEDDPGTVADRARKYAGLAGIDRDALRGLHVLEVDDPLFGPVPTDSGAELYNARPGRLPAWTTFEAAVSRVRPRVVFIDPATVAYCADQSSHASVREFVSALGRLARQYSLGVVLVAHSTKDTRRKRRPEDRDPFDPGLIAGSAAWTDGVRGVLAVQWGKGTGERVIACPKSNYGPARVMRGLKAIRTDYGEIVGFDGDGEWSKPGGQAEVVDGKFLRAR